MFFADRLTLDAPRLTRDGYLVTRARAARLGTYSYDGAEIDPSNEHGLRDAGIVNVLRDESTVFDEAAARSFIGKPVTDNHPSSPVTAGNWRDVARGMVMGAMRDGDYLAFDLLLTDAAAIDKVNDGKRELSNGYSATIEFGDFTAADGTKCVARQTSIAGNHVALVDQGRAGNECRIADAAICDAATAEIAGRLLSEITTDERTYSGSPNPHKTDTTNNGGRQVADTKTIIRDGFSIVVTDQAETYIGKLEDSAKQLTDKLATADTKIGELTAAVSTKDGEIAALTQKVKDAEISPEKLEKLVADRSALITQAKAIDPNIVTDGKTEGEIRKAVVMTKLGDAAKDMNDGAIGGAFAVLAKDVKVDPIRNVMSGAAPQNMGDAKSEYLAARDLARKNLSDGWKQPAANAA
jgi:hypothetical protein